MISDNSFVRFVTYRTCLDALLVSVVSVVSFLLHSTRLEINNVRSILNMMKRYFVQRTLIVLYILSGTFLKSLTKFILSFCSELFFDALLSTFRCYDDDGNRDFSVQFRVSKIRSRRRLLTNLSLP